MNHELRESAIEKALLILLFGQRAAQKKSGDMSPQSKQEMVR